MGSWFNNLYESCRRTDERICGLQQVYFVER